MKDEPVRRLVGVLLGYALLAWLALLLGGWLQRVLALPGLFETLLRWGVLAGTPIAGLVAWHYPSIGHGDGDPARLADSALAVRDETTSADDAGLDA